MPSSLVGDGRKTVTTAGTAVQVLATPISRADSTCVTALAGNTDKIVVGGSTVVAALLTRRGTPLAAGESVTYSCDPSLLWIDSVVSGEGVSYSYEAK